MSTKNKETIANSQIAPSKKAATFDTPTITEALTDVSIKNVNIKSHVIVPMKSACRANRDSR